MRPFCERPGCQWNRCTSDKELHISVPVGNHIETKVIRREYCKSRRGDFYLCSDCAEVLKFLENLNAGLLINTSVGILSTGDKK